MEKSAYLIDDKVHIAFPFDLPTIEVVRQIQGRRWDEKSKVWTVPATPYHFHRVIEVLGPLGFSIDAAIKEQADPKATPRKMSYPAGLYPFQRAGVDFLYQTDGRAILADDMGLGKTVTALSYIKMFGGRTLIVCPASVVWKWREEWEKWTGNPHVQVVQSGKDIIEEDSDAVIMSYGIMVSKFDALQSTLFNVVVFDEAHALKSYKAQRTRCGRAIARRADKVLFLSGTPFMNHPTELFSLLNMLDAIGYDNFFSFAKRYCGAEYVGGHWYIPKDIVTNRDELAQRLGHVMIRRTKGEVLADLPDLTRTYIPTELSNKAEYNRALKDVKEWLKSRNKKTEGASHALTRLNVLRQIVGAGKIQAAIELAQDILQGDGQVVLFCHHKETVTSLYTALREHGVGIISGDVSQKERQNLVDGFLAGKFRVMIITTAGAEGINLYSASNIIFVEREWTPAKEEQAEARLHRIGQKNSVNAYYLVARGTVDEKLNNIVQTKRSLVGQVLTQDYILEKLLEEL